jgi:hypothetical protein
MIKTTLMILLCNRVTFHKADRSPSSSDLILKAKDPFTGKGLISILGLGNSCQRIRSSALVQEPSRKSQVVLKGQSFESTLYSGAPELLKCPYDLTRSSSIIFVPTSFAGEPFRSFSPFGNLPVRMRCFGQIQRNIIIIMKQLRINQTTHLFPLNLFNKAFRVNVSSHPG